MALTAEEREFALQVIFKYTTISPTPHVDPESFFTFIEADDAGKRAIIKTFIEDEIKAKQDAIQRHVDGIAYEQAQIADLQAKVKP